MNRVTLDELQSGLMSILGRLQAGEELVITCDGEAIGLFVRTDERSLPEQLQALRLATFRRTAHAIRQEAKSNGADLLTEDQIQEEIDAVRRERQIAESPPQKAPERGDSRDHGGM